MKHYPIFLALLFLPLISFAQPEGELEGEEVEVIADFEATLQEAIRVEVMPNLPDLTEGDKNLVYEIPARKVELEYLPPKLRPLGAKKQEPEQGYNGYAKLGYGFPNSPYGEIGYEYIDAEKFRVGGELMHHSANYKKRENQKFSNTGGKIGGAYFLDNGNTAEANIGFTSDVFHFYGYNPELLSFTDDQVRQQFNEFNLGAKFFNSTKNRLDINYKAGIDFYTFTDNYATNENGFDLKVSGTKWFAEKHPLEVTLRTDFSVYKDGLKQSLNNFYLQPNFTFHSRIFKVKAGINLASSNDEFYVFPDIEANVNIIGNTIALFAGTTGDIYKNNLRSLSNYNPFISTYNSLEIRNSGYKYYYGGVKGNLKTVNYQASLGFKDVGDLALFVNNPMDSIRFQTIYDSTEIFIFKGSIGANLSDDLHVTITAAQNIFKTSTANQAFGLPNFEANLSIQYKMLRDKLTLKADVFSESGVHIRDQNLLEDKLAGVFDLSFAGEYYFMENFGVFAQVNNLLANNRQRWYRYPTYGLNILGGISARF